MEHTNSKEANDIHKQGLAGLLSKHKMNDVHFCVGNESIGIKEFDGIRCLFAAQSEVLENMLYGVMAESLSSNDVIIEDITPDSFEWFKQYCYGLNPIVNKNNIVDVLYLCDKYCIKNLHDLYIKQFVQNYGLTDLKVFLDVINELCIKNQVNAVTSILNSDEFGSLNDKKKQEILLNLHDKLTSLHPSTIVNILFKSKINFIDFIGQEDLWCLVKHYCITVAYFLCKDSKTPQDMTSNRKQKRNMTVCKVWTIWIMKTKRKII